MCKMPYFRAVYPEPHLSTIIYFINDSYAEYIKIHKKSTLKNDIGRLKVKYGERYTVILIKGELEWLNIRKCRLQRK